MKYLKVLVAIVICFNLGASSAMAAPLEISLDEAVQMALKNNPSGKIAVFDYEAAKGALTAARSYRWPTASVSHTDKTSMTSVSSTNVFTYADYYSNAGTVSWVLWAGNKYQAKISQAKFAVDSTKWGIVETRQQLKYDATNAYFSLMAARDLLKLSQDSVDRLEKHLKDVQLQFEVGTVAKVDVLRSEVELANAKQDLIKAQNTFDLAMATLNNVLGLPLTTDLKPKGDLTYSKYDITLNACIEFGMKNRPDIFQAQDNMKSAEEGVTVARAGYYPTVTATYTTGYNDTKFIGDKNYNWSAYLTTSWTILDSGLTAGTLRQAAENYKKAVEQYRQTVDSTQLDIQSSFLSMREAEKRIDTSAVAVNQAEENFRIAEIRYQAGVGTNLDVLDSQSALNQAKTNFLKAMYDYNTNRSKLDKAMGVVVQ